MKYLILILTIALLLSSCASLESNLGLGMGIGASTGIVGGYAGNLNAKGMMITGVAGAALGGLIAFLVHSNSTKDKPLPSSEISASFLAPGQEPILRKAEKDYLWVPGTIQNEKYIEPHRVWTIKTPSHWEHPQKENKENDDE